MISVFRLRNLFATRCMILHPVSFPNKGAIVEQYLAEQAVGLASSLGWEIVRGPYWNFMGKNLIVPSMIRDLDRESDLVSQFEEEISSWGQIEDGRYVQTLVGKGVKDKDGVFFDPYQSESDGDLHEEWRNKLKRESIANSSLIKTKRVTQKTYFTKGKLDPIASHIKNNQVDCVFVNKELKPTQVRNLTKILEAKINNVSQIYYSGGQNDSETQLQSEDVEELVKRQGKQPYRKIKVFDRFSIILQIFAQRTTTKLSKLQIELSFLSYLKTRLVREGSAYSSNLNIFYGDLMKARQVNLEIISAKQRRAFQTMSGEGESQLEIERRNIRDKEAKIRREIQEETRLRNIRTDKKQKSAAKLPTVALVGYTNVGKSAFMNAVMKRKETESRDLLFQTLATTSRHVQLMSGRRINLLDTIGFITDLPVELIESFKATLEEVAHADLVIHLRDISSPHSDLQKQSVLKILGELKLTEKFKSENMIEVWNKVDLVPISERKQMLRGTQSPIQISCITGEGLQALMRTVDLKLRQITGSKFRVIEYSLSKHYRVVEWLKANTNLPFELNEKFDHQPNPAFPHGRVTIELEIDDANYGKIMKYIEGDSFNKAKKSVKGMPPREGW